MIDVDVLENTPQLPGEALWVMTSLPVKRPHWGADIAQLPVAHVHTQGKLRVT
jgi:hypothetical protein